MLTSNFLFEVSNSFFYVLEFLSGNPHLNSPPSGLNAISCVF
nr:MAG TPA: hypothetical protein [Caudoviricetes sp.]